LQGVEVDIRGQAELLLDEAIAEHIGRVYVGAGIAQSPPAGAR
jgi:hypothetical protein